MTDALTSAPHKSRIWCSLSPFQAKDAVENAALSVPALQDKHTAQDVEVQLVLWDWAHHPGLEEGGPLPLQGPLAAPVILRTKEAADELMDGWMDGWVGWWMDEIKSLWADVFWQTHPHIAYTHLQQLISDFDNSDPKIWPYHTRLQKYRHQIIMFT